MSTEPEFKKTLLVTRDHNHALVIAEQKLGRPRIQQFRSNDNSVMVTWPTASLMGNRFDEIRIIAGLIDDQPSISQRENTRRWLRESVACRLMPGGQMHEVKEL